MMKVIGMIGSIYVLLIYMSKFNSWYMLGWLMTFMLVVMTSIPEKEMIKFMNSLIFMDIMSYSMLMLSSYLFILMYMSSALIMNKNMFMFQYNTFLWMLLSALLLSFSSSNYLLFYIFFEISLIPTLYIVLGWGYQPERLQAGIYFMMYTLVASLPLLVGLLAVMYSSMNLFMWDSLMLNYWSFETCKFITYSFMVMMVMAFLVKLPMFMVHLWLPSAHVEAPVAGSMILAGVLLKLGGYGLIRVLKKFYYLLSSVSILFISISLIGMVFIGLLCCRMNDLKSLVAYSSVAHMSLVICGTISGVTWGVSGGLMMMVSHGLSSSGLFCFVNMLYERVSSRSMYINKGVVVVLPLFTLMFFLLCCSNISAPPSINLLSEIMLMASICFFDKFSMFLFSIGSFLGAVFTFYMFSSSQHGKIYFSMNSVISVKMLEFHSLMLHILPVNMLIFKNSVFFNFM